MLHEVIHSALTAVVRLASAVLPAAPLMGQKPLSQPAVKNIVLVNGAFADGSSWYKVIPPLKAMGYHVVAVQNRRGDHLGKGSNGSAGNGGIGRKEDGCGDRNSAHLPHGHPRRAGQGCSGDRSSCERGIKQRIGVSRIAVD